MKNGRKGEKKKEKKNPRENKWTGVAWGSSQAEQSRTEQNKVEGRTSVDKGLDV
jgi:hypothetical protein